MRVTSPTLMAITLLLTAETASANGRFPQAQHLVAGPGVRDDLILVRATFGLLLSDDGGQRFRFLCEDAWEFLDGFDPTVLVGGQGSMLVGLTNGLTRSRDGCAPTRDPDLDGYYVADLAANPAGSVVIAAAMPPGPRRARVARAINGGERFEVLPFVFDDATLNTVEVGDAAGTTLYASGAVGDARAPALWRSDDGGQHWSRSAAHFAAGDELYIAGVHPTRPRVIWVRAAREGDAGLGGTALLRSDDGGETFREVGQTRGPMRGFALRGDGEAVWIGGPSDGLLRSDGGGAFRVVSEERVECLRWHANTLWACGTFAPGAVMLWRAHGDGALAPALRWSDVEPPPVSRCAPGTPLREICPQRWQSVRGVIGAGRPDAGLDAGAVDAGVSPPPPSGCRCHVGAKGGAGRWGLAALALWVTARARGSRAGTRGPRRR
ncbi:MAG: hypothetical protein U0325_22420 [Polyangiales bacterium]